MDAALLKQPGENAQRYSWSLVLPRPRARNAPLRPETLNASELMFFFGAPLAHVVRYEEHLRAHRQERTIRQISRARRTYNFAAQLAALRHLPPALPDGGDGA